MGERYKPLIYVFRKILEWLLSAYVFYILFLFLWSTFDKLIPKGVLGFVLALVITALFVGLYGWFQFFYQKGEKEN